MSKKLRFFVPSGTLKSPLQDLYFPKLGIALSDKKYPDPCAETEHFEFVWADRRSIPDLIAQGVGHAGITGFDLYLEHHCRTGETLRKLAELPFTRAGNDYTELVFAFRTWNADGSLQRIVTEYPYLCEKQLQHTGAEFPYKITQIEGNEEWWVAEGKADFAFVVKDSGNSISHLGLTTLSKFVGLKSCPCVFVCEHDFDDSCEDALKDLAWALRSVVLAKRHVMVTFDIPREALLQINLPAEVAPTINDLSPDRPDWAAGQICIERSEFGRIGRKIQKAGGRAIVMQDVEAYQSGVGNDELCTKPPW